MSLFGNKQKTHSLDQRGSEALLSSKVDDPLFIGNHAANANALTQTHKLFSSCPEASTPDLTTKSPKKSTKKKSQSQSQSSSAAGSPQERSLSNAVVWDDNHVYLSDESSDDDKPLTKRNEGPIATMPPRPQSSVPATYHPSSYMTFQQLQIYTRGRTYTLLFVLHLLRSLHHALVFAGPWLLLLPRNSSAVVSTMPPDDGSTNQSAALDFNLQTDASIKDSSQSLQKSMEYDPAQLWHTDGPDAMLLFAATCFLLTTIPNIAIKTIHYITPIRFQSRITPQSALTLAVIWPLITLLPLFIVDITQENTSATQSSTQERHSMSPYRSVDDKENSVGDTCDEHPSQTLIAIRVLLLLVATLCSSLQMTHTQPLLHDLATQNPVLSNRVAAYSFLSSIAFMLFAFRKCLSGDGWVDLWADEQSWRLFAILLSLFFTAGALGRFLVWRLTRIPDSPIHRITHSSTDQPYTVPMRFAFYIVPVRQPVLQKQAHASTFTFASDRSDTSSPFSSRESSIEQSGFTASMLFSLAIALCTVDQSMLFYPVLMYHAEFHPTAIALTYTAIHAAMHLGSWMGRQTGNQIYKRTAKTISFYGVGQCLSLVWIFGSLVVLSLLISEKHGEWILSVFCFLMFATSHYFVEGTVVSFIRKNYQDQEANFFQNKCNLLESSISSLSPFLVVILARNVFGYDDNSDGDADDDQSSSLQAESLGYAMFCVHAVCWLVSLLCWFFLTPSPPSGSPRDTIDELLY